MKRKILLVILIGVLLTQLSTAYSQATTVTDKEAPGVGTSQWNRALENRYSYNSNWINSSIFAVFGYINRFTQSISKWAVYISRIFLTLDLIVLGVYLAFGLVEIKKEIITRIIKVAVISSCLMWYPKVMNYIITISTQIATLADQDIANKVSDVAAERLGKYERRLNEIADNDEGGFLGFFDAHAAERTRLTKTIAYLQAFKDIEGRPKVYYHAGIYETTLPPWMLKPLNTKGGAVYVDPEYLMMWGGLAFQPLKDDIDRLGPMDIGRSISMNLVYLLGNICLVICVIQYLMTILEYAILTAVGSLALPLGYFKLTQFAIEKLIGAIFAFSIKIIISTMVIQLIIYCYVDLTTVNEWVSSNDQLLKFIFTSLFCIILSTTIPSVVSSFLSGTPNLGISQVGQVGHAIIEGFQTVMLMKNNLFSPHTRSENTNSNNSNSNTSANSKQDSSASSTSNSSGKGSGSSSGSKESEKHVSKSNNVESRGPSSELAGSLESKSPAQLKQDFNNLFSSGSSPLNPARVEDKAKSLLSKDSDRGHTRGKR